MRNRSQCIDVLYVAVSGLTASVGGGWIRMISEAKRATQHSLGVQILCFFPPQHVFKWRFVSSLREKMAQQAGCNVFFVPRLPLRRVLWIYRLNEWYCGLMVWVLCWRCGIRIVHGQGITPTFFALIARRINHGIKVVADIHGASVEEYLYEKKLIQKDATAIGMEKQEAMVLAEADWVIFVSQAMQEYFTHKYRARFDDSSNIPCATESTFMIDSTRRDVLRKQYGLEANIVFCYAGSAENYQLPEKMCRLFRKILDHFPNAFFLVFSPYRDLFAKHLESATIPATCYRVLSVEHEAIFDLLQMGDVGFLLRDNSIVNRVSSPTKFVEYCLCGLPVLTTAFVGDISGLVTQHELGWIIDLTNPTLDSELIRLICQVREKREEYARRCSSFAKDHFSWEYYGRVLVRIYRDLLKGNSLPL